MSIIFRPGLDFREAAGGLGRPWAKDAVNPGGKKRMIIFEDVNG